MSDVINKAKELSAANKFLYIIDTMAEVDDAQLARELGHHNFCLFHTYSYEQCKQLMVIATRDIPEELRDKCAFIINNFKMMTTERMMQLAIGAIDPTVEVEVEGDVPGETETVTQSVEIQEMMKCRKLMKDLAYTIRDIRKNGIEVDVLEGIDNPSLLDIYRMSGTCNKYDIDENGCIDEPTQGTLINNHALKVLKELAGNK